MVAGKMNRGMEERKEGRNFVNTAYVWYSVVLKARSPQIGKSVCTYTCVPSRMMGWDGLVGSAWFGVGVLYIYTLYTNQRTILLFCSPIDG